MDTLTREDRMMLQALDQVQPGYDYVQFKGGWDQVSPALSLPPGILRDCQNFEVVPAGIVPTGGYGRVGGYERFDGNDKPSNATFALIQVSSFTNVPSTGQTLTGETSGATGVIIAVSESSKYVALTKLSGSFSNSEVVKVGATTIGTATALTVTLSEQVKAQYTNLAADQYRSDIAAVPGSGPIRGVVHLVVSGSDKVFAFRDNTGGALTILYQSSASGWSLVPFYNEVSFTAGGTSTPSDGATLTQGIVTATIKRVVLESGSWAAGTAAGRLIVTDPTGGNFSAAAATAGSVAVTLSGIQTAITLTVGGRFEFVKANFAGQAATRRLYGCDGINRGFEFDGLVFVPITTGTASDTPKHVIEHRNHLFFAFGSSAIHSAPGLPYDWTALSGASEIAIGDTIAGFLIQPGTETGPALWISGLESTSILYGTGVNRWEMVRLHPTIGGVHYMGQNLARSYTLFSTGVIDLQAVQVYGNFEQATLTYGIQTFIKEKRSKATYSALYRGKSQYRAFFSDGSGLYLTIVNGKFLGGTQVFFPNPVYCAFSGFLDSGEEVSYFGAAEGGMVYEMEKGSSFDGEDIDAYITLNWNTMKRPRQLKEFFKGVLEVIGNFYASLSVSYLLAYNSSAVPQASAVSVDTNVSGSSWDTVNWDEFIWDGQTLEPTEIDFNGLAEAIQVRIASGTDYIYPYTLASLQTRWAPADQLR